MLSNEKFRVYALRQKIYYIIKYVELLYYLSKEKMSEQRIYKINNATKMLNLALKPPENTKGNNQFYLQQKNEHKSEVIYFTIFIYAFNYTFTVDIISVADFESIRIP